jgi:hypothetical protein
MRNISFTALANIPLSAATQFNGGHDNVGSATPAYRRPEPGKYATENEASRYRQQL